jgi:holliday junction DNA helicase RuvA
LLAYLRGKIVSNQPTAAIIESGGIGFEVQITLTTYDFLKDKSEALLYTHLHVKLNGQSLAGYEIYGFTDIQDKQIFELLIEVSGIGANTARLMLNAMSQSEIRRAIISDDERTLSSIKGIGPKTAKRAILELKDKMLKISNEDIQFLTTSNKIKEDALIALMTLGYQKNNVTKVLNTIESKGDAKSVEDYIKLALKSL